MDEKILTITIPSYNVKDYLDECLSSFINDQVMDKIEILIVNDGSTDSTAEIALSYQEKYPDTFRLITKENGGHGSTINTGVKEAKGKYFKVVDGDDWVNTDEFVLLVNRLEQEDTDLVASNYTWINHTTKLPEKRQEHPFEKISYNYRYDFEEIVGKTSIDMHATTIKTELLRRAGEQIDEHTYYVDVEYIMFPIPYVKTVLFLDYDVYQYRLGLPNQSMAISKMQQNLKNHLRVLMRVSRYTQKMAASAQQPQLQYMDDIVAAMLTSQMKIYISFPLGSGMRKEAMKLDAYFYNHHRTAYDKVKNPAVLLLRRTRYLLFPFAVIAFRGRRNSY